MKMKNNTKIFILLFLMITTASNSPRVMESVKASLSVCFSAVIPSLFPFMVLSSAFTSSLDRNSFKWAQPLVRRLFGVSASGMGAFLCGIISGYPIGAKSVYGLYTNGKITKSEAESLLAYSNNSGPLFVIGAVGCGIYQSISIGICLYAVHILCALICALVLKEYTYSGYSNNKCTGQGMSLTECICQSVQSVLKVCGFIVFFGFVCEIMTPAVMMFPKSIQCIIYSFLEITNGINYTSGLAASTPVKLSLTAAALGWSGLSVHMQVKEIIKDTNLSLKKYYIAKVCTSILSGLIFYVGSNNTDNIVSNINIKQTKLIFSLIFAVALVVVLILKRKKRGASSPFFDEY